MSLKFAESFAFMQKNTFVHRLDPRSKLIMIIVYSILAFTFRNLLLMLLTFGTTIPLLLMADMKSKFFESMKGLSFLIIFILIINSYVSGINNALLIILRLIVLMTVFALFFQTTQPEDLTQSFYRLGMKYSTAFSFSLAFRFVPTMARETQIIMDAQRSRGHHIEEGGMLQQIRNLFPLLVPLVLGSIRRAFHVAEALETRAFGQTEKPSFYYDLKWKKIDYIFISLNLILLVAGLYFHLNLEQFGGILWDLQI